MSVFPIVPGSPDLSTGSSSQYIPAIYSALLIKKFYPQTVFGECSNTDYEGDIKTSGDTIYIRTRPTIETFKYKKGMVLPIQNPESPYITMVINQGEGFSFALDKVDAFQSDIKLMNVWGEDAAAQMKQVIDKNLLGSIAGAAGGTAVVGSPLAAFSTYASVAGATPLWAGGITSVGTTIGTASSTTVTANNKAGSMLGTATYPMAMGIPNATAVAAGAYASPGDALVAQILYYARLLDENNVPDADRFVILSASMIQTLKNTSSKFAQVYVTGDQTSPLRNGQIGRIDRFKIYSSNNLPAIAAGTNSKAIIFGQKYATTFATQITESRIIDNPFAFGKMMQGLQVYGFNIIKQGFIGVDFMGDHSLTS